MLVLKEREGLIPEFKGEIISSFQSDPQLSFINSLTDSDIINVYAEWLLKNKSTDRSTQNGFIFEILSRRFVQDIEPSTNLLQSIKEVFVFLGDGQNQRLIWNEERSTPDDIVLSPTKHSIQISKIIECKVSTHALTRSLHQKESTKSTVRSLINVLNGNYYEVKSDKGKKIITGARERLRRLCPLPLALSPNYKYVYVLPSDQHYLSQNPRDTNLEVINLPLNTTEIDLFRQSIFTYLAQVAL